MSAATPTRGTQLALLQEEKQTAPLTSWALVELFGHQRIVGWVVVDPPEFPGMVRVDVPDLLKNGSVVRAGFTRYVGKAALYGVTPITEDAVKELLPEISGRPEARPLSFGFERDS